MDQLYNFLKDSQIIGVITGASIGHIFAKRQFINKKRNEIYIQVSEVFYKLTDGKVWLKHGMIDSVDYDQIKKLEIQAKLYFSKKVVKSFGLLSKLIDRIVKNSLPSDINQVEKLQNDLLERMLRTI